MSRTELSDDLLTLATHFAADQRYRRCGRPTSIREKKIFIYSSPDIYSTPDLCDFHTNTCAVAQPQVEVVFFFCLLYHLTVHVNTYVLISFMFIGYCTLPVLLCQINSIPFFVPDFTSPLGDIQNPTASVAVSSRLLRAVGLQFLSPFSPFCGSHHRTSHRCMVSVAPSLFDSTVPLPSCTG